MKVLTEKLAEWTDIDGAEHQLALTMGLIKEEDGSFQVDFKWIYWTNNRYGNALHDILMKMVEIGLLEYDVEEMRIRAVRDFKLKGQGEA